MFVNIIRVNPSTSNISVVMIPYLHKCIVHITNDQQEIGYQTTFKTWKSVNVIYHFFHAILWLFLSKYSYDKRKKISLHICRLYVMHTHTCKAFLLTYISLCSYRWHRYLWGAAHATSWLGKTASQFSTIRAQESVRANSRPESPGGGSAVIREDEGNFTGPLTPAICIQMMSDQVKHLNLFDRYLLRYIDCQQISSNLNYWKNLAIIKFSLKRL